jgi:hypothetical protein
MAQALHLVVIAVSLDCSAISLPESDRLCFRPEGAEDCSHGWSEASLAGEAQPVEKVFNMPAPSGGGGGTLAYQNMASPERLLCPAGAKEILESAFHGFRNARKRRRSTRGYSPSPHSGRNAGRCRPKTAKPENSTALTTHHGKGWTCRHRCRNIGRDLTPPGLAV